MMSDEAVRRSEGAFCDQFIERGDWNGTFCKLPAGHGGECSAHYPSEAVWGPGFDIGLIMCVDEKRARTAETAERMTPKGLTSMQAETNKCRGSGRSGTFDFRDSHQETRRRAGRVRDFISGKMVAQPPEPTNARCAFCGLWVPVDERGLLNTHG